MALITKLNPPQLASKLPAFAYNKNQTSSTLTIPFNLNRSVGKNQFNSVAVIVKSVQTNVEKYSGITTIVNYNYKNHNYEAVVALPNSESFPQAGQYYKVQIACVDDITDSNNPIIGYYSTVGVVKCTTRPSISIKDREGVLNNTYEYTGLYSQQDGDVTEKVYSYCFNLYDESNNIIATSGEQIHDSSTDGDIIYESTDTWIIHKALEPNINYEIGYKVTTMNGYYTEEVRYPIVEAETIMPNVHASLEAESLMEDGYIKVFLVGDGKPVRVSGSFLLLRASNEDNYDSWYELSRFQLSQWDATTIKEICKDYTVKQGYEYKYAIQAYNSSGLFSNRMSTKPVLCDFEDAFLYDGERQLKIRFNPKVSNFKSTVLETKTDTIGGHYPFVFRNGNVEYKEFQISGLLSVLGDENDEFLTGLPEKDTARRQSPASPAYSPSMGTWLTAENYKRERLFKMEALKWLNNGKPKLFRSPAEGNFIVRLMNVTLTPNDTLGRMLHTFNAAAYEIAECNFENLQKFGFTVEPYVETRTLKINQINLNNVPSNMQNKDGSIAIPSAYIASISASPDVDFSYALTNSSSNYISSTNLTGTYVFPENVLKEAPLTMIKLESDSWGDVAYLTYGYYDTTVDTFSYIYNVAITDKIVQQSGLGLYMFDEKGNVKLDYTDAKNPTGLLDESKNIIPLYEDFRLQTGAFHYIRVKTKTILDVYLDSSTNTWMFDKTSPVEIWNPTCLYKEGNQYIDGNNPPVYDTKAKKWNKNWIPVEEVTSDLYLFKMDDSTIVDFSGNDKTDGRYEALTNISSIDKLYAGKGLVLDIVYQQREITYTVEIENNSLRELKKTWLNYKELYETTKKESYKKSMDAAYAVYIKQLEISANKMKEEYNIEYAI